MAASEQVMNVHVGVFFRGLGLVVRLKRIMQRMDFLCRTLCECVQAGSSWLPPSSTFSVGQALHLLAGGSNDDASSCGTYPCPAGTNRTSSDLCERQMESTEQT
jgi:hypothetical protein